MLDAEIREQVIADHHSDTVRNWTLGGGAATLASDSVDLGFFNRATVYRVQLVRSTPSETEWFCKSGKEWEGTRLRFQLTETKGQTLLRFTHADWEADTDYFVSCNTTWGALMFRLKAAAEDKPTVPLFSKTGWAL